MWTGHEESRPEGEWTLLVTGTCFHLSSPGGDWMQGAASFPEEGAEGPLDLRIDECDCPTPGATAHALFHLRGDELRLAGLEPGSPERPSSFTAPGARVFRLQRRSP